MAFGFEYWMVYLPDFNKESILLFVHNPAGSTKLRDYSSGTARVVGQPECQLVCTQTTVDQTRFLVEPHRTTDDTYWSGRTLEFNSRYLSCFPKTLPSVIAAETDGRDRAPGHTFTSGRAERGSRRQLQDYVNEHERALTRAVLEVLPPRLQELGAGIRWVSPLAKDNYKVSRR